MSDEQNEESSEKTTNPSSLASEGTIKAKPKKKSIVRRAFGAMGRNIKAAGAYVTETHLFKIATSNAVANILTITLTVLALAGVTATPFGPVVVGVLAGLALAGVAVKMTVDMVQARSLRRLEKENNVLVKNRDAKAHQVQILKDNPKLENILKDELFKPEEREGKKSVTQRLAQDTSKGKVIAKGVGKAFLKQGLDVGLAIVNTIATSSLGLAIKIGGIVMSLFSFGMESRAKVNVDSVRYDLKKQIDSERDKPDTPGYNNIRDLKTQVREQRIQTMALKELVADKNYPSMSEKQIKTRFTEIKDKLHASEKAIGTSRNIFVRGLRAIGSVIKDIGRGQSPYSKFNNPEKIVVKTPGMDNQPVEKSKSDTQDDNKLSKLTVKVTQRVQVSKHVVDPPSSQVIVPMKKLITSQKKGVQTSSKIR